MLVQFPLDRIVAGLNNRVHSGFSPASLRELADSLRLHGQVQPIVLRRVWIWDGVPVATVDGHDTSVWNAAFEAGNPTAVAQLCAGERRTRAAALVPWTTIEAKLRNLDDKAALSVMFVENGNRVDIDPIDEGEHYRGMKEQYGYTDQAIAEIACRSPELVRDRIALTRLRPELQKLLREKQLPMKHAILLSQLDVNRQAIAKAVFTAGKMPSWSVFQNMVAELSKAQAEEGQLDLFDIARQQAALIVKATKTGQAARLKRLKVPADLRCRLAVGKGQPMLANQIKAWADLLPEAQRLTAYAVIEALIEVDKLPFDDREW